MDENTTQQHELMLKQDDVNFSKDTFKNYLKPYLPKEEDTQDYLDNALLQPNEISRAIYGMTTSSLKIFCYLIKQFKLEQRSHSSRVFELNVNKFLSDLDFPDGGRTRTAVEETVEELAKTFISVKTKDSNFYATIFEATNFNKKTGFVSFCFSEWFACVLERKIGGNFTLLNFEEMSKLSSFYSIRFYQIAMSFKGFKGRFKKPDNEWFKKNIKDSKNTWFFGYSLEQLKILFQVKDKYKQNSHFLKRIIEEPIKELSEKIKDYEFKCQIIRKNNKPNGKIEGFIFWVTDKSENQKNKTKKTKQEQVLTLENFVPYDLQQYYDEKVEEKKKFQEDDQKPVIDMLEKYPEEFNKRLEEVSKQPHMLKMPILLKHEVYKSMIADGFTLNDEQK